MLQQWQSGALYTASWLNEQGFSNQLLYRYKQGGWLSSFGQGAFIRTGDQVDYYGGLYAIQTQLNYSVHIGARTALALQGKAHYLELSQKKAILIGRLEEILPTWFKKHPWDVQIEYFRTSFLPASLGLMDFNVGNLVIKISDPVRAMLECLYLCPEHQDLTESCQLMEGLNAINPYHAQALLEQCSSFKTKRLFLYLAEKSHHTWMNYLDISKIDLGKGKRSLVKKGVYVQKYKITVPKEFEQHEQSSL